MDKQNKREEFKMFLRNIFKYIMKEEDMELILAPAPLKIFETAFTHRFVSDENYEIFEKIGDKILSSCFGMYLRRKFPSKNDPEFFNLVETFYCAKSKLKEISSKLGLPKYLVSPSLSTPNRSDKEDLFEAFIGATTVVCDEFITMHFGYGVAYELLAKLYDQEDIDPNNYLQYKSYVGQLKEIYDVKNWGNVIYRDNEKYRQPTDPYIITVYTPQGKSLGRGQSLIKKTAREEAAKNTIFRLGITTDNILQLREQKLVDSHTKPLIEKVKCLLNEKGYHNLRHKKRNFSGQIEVHVQSQNKQGIWTLISNAVASDERDAYIAALEAFIHKNSSTHNAEQYKQSESPSFIHKNSSTHNTEQYTNHKSHPFLHKNSFTHNTDKSKQTKLHSTLHPSPHKNSFTHNTDKRQNPKLHSTLRSFTFKKKQVPLSSIKETTSYYNQARQTFIEDYNFSLKQY